MTLNIFTMFGLNALFYLKYPFWWASVLIPSGIGIFFYFLNVFRDLREEKRSSYLPAGSLLKRDNTKKEFKNSEGSSTH